MGITQDSVLLHFQIYISLLGPPLALFNLPPYSHTFHFYWFFCLHLLNKYLFVLYYVSVTVCSWCLVYFSKQNRQKPLPWRNWQSMLCNMLEGDGAFSKHSRIRGIGKFQSGGWSWHFKYGSQLGLITSHYLHAVLKENQVNLYLSGTNIPGRKNSICKGFHRLEHVCHGLRQCVWRRARTKERW